jgi:uroporphyrin-III C-methyltransferase
LINKVYLVGAGPGDPELITFKGARVLGESEVVIYDRLAPAGVLKLAASAELISVGKEPGAALNSQDDINRLMAFHAMRGKKVVRLKGGDPLIFGRGGEEAEYLLSRGIPFEIVPGVTAASGVAASSGIPLTDRRYSSAVTFVAGHRAAGTGLDAVDWPGLSALGHTLVFYMGMANIREITGALLKHGKPGFTPAAIVSRATTAEQKAVFGTLSDIAVKCAQEALPAPALLIIGEAASHSVLRNNTGEPLWAAPLGKGDTCIHPSTGLTR